jgi:hypothetical protein
LLMLSSDPLDAVLLIRDDDRRTERLQGLERARRESTLAVPIVIGLAHPKRECWILAGFLAGNSDEERRLEELRQNLGFYPCVQAHQLTAKHDHDKRSAKRALAHLIGQGAEREAQCLQTDVRLLEQRGQETGLTAFLSEVRSRLLPLFRPPQGV